MKPRLKVWVTFDKNVKLGDGRARFLQTIDELGSIKKAVVAMGMSYRNAWGYLRDLERAVGFKLLERRTGPAGGTHLTPQGRAFLDRFWRFRQGLDEVVDRRFRRSFPQG